MNASGLLEYYDRVADTAGAIQLLRRFILELAVRGKITSQESSDGTADDLLARIAREHKNLALIKSRCARLPAADTVNDQEIPFTLPSTWRWTRLSAITSYIQRGKSPVYADTDGTPVISQRCVQWNGLDLSVAKYVTRDSLQKYEEARFLRAGDLLWNSTGTGTIGRVVRLVDPQPSLICDSHVTVVRSTLVDPEFIRCWLRSDHVYAVIENRAIGSTNQIELTAQMVRDQIVPLPPLVEQIRIVAKVDELMAICDDIEDKRAQREIARDRFTSATLARLKAQDGESGMFAVDARFAILSLDVLTTRPDQIKQLRETILNLGVRGKLVSQDPNDESATELLRRSASAGQLSKKSRRAQIAYNEEEPYPFLSPPNWTWTRLGSVGDWGSGSTPPRSNPELYGGGVTWLKSGELNDDTALSGSSETLTEVAIRTGSFRLNQPGDVLVAMYGATIGKAAILADDAVTNQAVCGCTPMACLVNKYLFTFLVSQRSEFHAASEGGAQPNISRAKIVSMRFPLPPLAEQRRIVAKVDELMAICDELESLLNARDKHRRRLLDALIAEALESTAVAIPLLVKL